MIARVADPTGFGECVRGLRPRAEKGGFQEAVKAVRGALPATNFCRCLTPFQSVEPRRETVFRIAGT